MSELNNPLFNNERDLLERQKEEYKNALMGDVEQIKSQGQEIGKKAAVAGGVLLAGFLVRRLFSGGKKKNKVKPPKVKSPKLKKGKKSKETLPKRDPNATYDEMGYRIDGGYSTESNYHILSSETANHPQDSDKKKTEGGKSFIKSELAQLVTNQLAALAMVYATKKIEEYLNRVPENTDIAPEPAPIKVIEVDSTEYIYPEKDAL
ncbi:hypothetical protein ACFSKU_07635 [Pontibacter silvestris]|uniref:Uncharacterized protein n=1 Tax=Pontibacter silvestris TaxID=2305183 RepID=A0ABW4WWY9_9BACT|nr:hypothetical protein [Pontibacter silvestris]MCC9136660.1 hypothetical protein [Pontibacter silvestris]